ncbi:prenylated Rab acceptor protein 1 isoform X3 [Zootermopsis nevadensis]|nr:prenylated Rab acceptor protein 1 isoform X3 [Zootermopsis nevadensis]
MFQLPVQVSLSSPAAKEWFGQRRENIRQWTVFVNTGNFRTPSSIPRLSKRVMRNVEYFQSNYFFVFLGLLAYCLITSPLLLIAVAVSLGACYILSLKNTERKIRIFAHELTLAQQYGLVALCSLPLFYLSGAGAAIFWVIGVSIFIIGLHAAFYNIDAVLNPEDERMDLIMEEV